MKDFEINDDYERYPIKDGEIELFPNTTYTTMLTVFKGTVEFSRIENDRWVKKIRDYCNPRKAKIESL